MGWLLTGVQSFFTTARHGVCRQTQCWRGSRYTLICRQYIGNPRKKVNSVPTLGSFSPTSSQLSVHVILISFLYHPVSYTVGCVRPVLGALRMCCPLALCCETVRKTFSQVWGKSWNLCQQVNFYYICMVFIFIYSKIRSFALGVWQENIDLFGYIGEYSEFQESKFKFMITNHLQFGKD